MLVNFFSKVGASMASNAPVPVSEGNRYSLDSAEALAPFLFALKDWSLGKFDDAGRMLGLYLASSPKAPFEWIADYKPIAQKYADDEAAYEKVSAAAAAADTPDKRAEALKQVQDLEARIKGKLASQLKRIEQDLKKKSADLDAPYIQRIAEEKQRDQTALTDAKHKYALLCADYRFDEARVAVDAAVVTGTDGVQQKASLLKKAGWLCQFKTRLIQDINAHGYTALVANRAGGHLPDGTRKATDSALLVQTQFGTLPFPWNSLAPSVLLTMENYFAQSLAATAPQDAAERQWLSGVFACEEGMPRDGHTLLVQASQVKDEYKDQLGIFLESE
jgi:hypothetical protein